MNKGCQAAPHKEGNHACNLWFATQIATSQKEKNTPREGNTIKTLQQFLHPKPRVIYYLQATNSR